MVSRSMESIKGQGDLMTDKEVKRKLILRKEVVSPGVIGYRYYIPIPVAMARKLKWKRGKNLKVTRGCTGIFIQED